MYVFGYVVEIKIEHFEVNMIDRSIANSTLVQYTPLLQLFNKYTSIQYMH